MDHIYPDETFKRASFPIKLNEHFLQYRQLLSKTLFANYHALSSRETDMQEKICFTMKIDDETYHELENSCSVSLLDCVPEENQPVEELDDDHLLETATKTLITAVELKMRRKAVSRTAIKHQRLTKDLLASALSSFVRNPAPSQKTQIPHDFVLAVRVFKPFRCFVGYAERIPHTHDILMLGGQSLSALRDKIVCLAGEVVLSEAQGDPRTKMKDLFSSGTFFIGNTFYRDGRDSVNKDYGELIDHWAKENPEMCIGPFEHKLMEKTILSSMEIQLGKPYVYMHLGTCEHLFIFTDARLQSPEDPEDPSEYPLVVQVKQEPIICIACDTLPAKWVLEDDTFPVSPGHLCDECYKAYYAKRKEEDMPRLRSRIPDLGADVPGVLEVAPQEVEAENADETMESSMNHSISEEDTEEDDEEEDDEDFSSS